MPPTHTEPVSSAWSEVLPAGGQPLVEAPPAARTFEIALALAGAVSAGAYIAGVLDRIFEAMDDWEERRASGAKDIPDWNVSLRVLSGASAGGVTAAIAAIAAGREFPPATDDPSARSNPFHHAWVRSIDIVPLLGSGDGTSGLPASLLDATALDDVLKGTVGLIAGRDKKPRPWIHKDLKVLLTTCNLDGVAYRFPLAGVPNGFYASCVHADVARFTLAVPTRLDELQITDAASGPFLSAALATAAFPIGLAARDVMKPANAEALIRRLDNCADIPLARILGGAPETYKATLSVGSISPTEAARRYAAMDGGTMDNEPVELARLELAGAAGRSPREGEKANRAVILVDPLVDMPGTRGSPAAQVNIVNGLGRLLTAYKNGARASATNMALAARPDVYSRFLISPFLEREARPVLTGPPALAGGGLAGFLGFFGVHLRQHDFDLGRSNAEHFLLHAFRLPVDNPLFGDDAKAKWGQFITTGERGPHLPVIPLFEATAPQPARPTIGVDIDALTPLLKSRISRVVERSIAAIRADPGVGGCANAGLGIVAAPLRMLVTSFLVTKAVALIRAADSKMKKV